MEFFVLNYHSSIRGFIVRLEDERIVWRPGDEMTATLHQVSGDIVQAIQALKESKPKPTERLRDLLDVARHDMANLERRCLESDEPRLEYPFKRADRQIRDLITFLYPASSGDAEGQTLRLPVRPATIQVSPPGISAPTVETFQLGHFRMPRLFNGLWQLSSAAWGSAAADSQESALANLVSKGLIATDMADHYVSTISLQTSDI